MADLFSEWDSVDLVSIAQAAHLWEGLPPEPGHVVKTKAYARFRRLKNRLTELGHIPAGRGMAKADQTVSRELLKRIAEERNERPAFLYPEVRRAGPGREKGQPKESTIARRKDAYNSVERALDTLVGQDPVARAANRGKAIAYAADYSGGKWTESQLARADRYHRSWLKR